jgi:hypothetical protein
MKSESYISPLKKATERMSEKELTFYGKLATYFEECSLSLEEKISNIGLFLTRQKISYLIANYEIFKLIENVKGSIFYFGVYHGSEFLTFANMSAALEPFNHTRELIGFDTFAGYPEITEKDKTHGKEFHTLVNGGFSSDQEEFLRKMLLLYDENRPLNHVLKTKLIKGDVCETLPNYFDNNQHTIVSLAVFTMNLYEPTKKALKMVWERMPKGGVVIIRSLNEDYYPGATCAVFDVLGHGIRINTFSYAPNLAYILKD